MRKALGGSIAADLFSPPPSRPIHAAEPHGGTADAQPEKTAIWRNVPSMIELASTRCSADSAELDISCAFDCPSDQSLRRVRATVSVESLLPTHAIVSNSRHNDTGAANMAWRVKWQELAEHTALIRATFAMDELQSVYSARRPSDGARSLT